MLIVDAHLDLSYNALRGRDVLRPAAEQAADEQGIPTVGLPDLRQGGVDLVCATIYCQPQTGEHPGYRTADEAHAMAIEQLGWYRQQQQYRQLDFVLHRQQLDPSSADIRPRIILLMEGADPILSPDDAATWFSSGIRIVGLAWKRTRYAGGTGAPGPLTPEGVDLVRALDAVGMIHDLSHLSEQSFWELLEISDGPVIASHSNCRAIVPGDRQLSDDMIRAVIARGGVIGINFFDKFLLPPEEYGKRRATLDDVVRHIRHICDLAGNADQVALGTDMDGGLGRDEIPVEIQTSADMHLLESHLRRSGFSAEEIRRILSENWVRFFTASLPLSRYSGRGTG